MKGQISLWLALVSAGGMVVASAFTSWATVSSRISSAENKVSVVEEREQNHFLEVSKALERIEKKMDNLLEPKIIKK